MKKKIQHYSSLLAVGVLCGTISWATSLSAQAPAQSTPNQPTTQQNPGQAPNEPGQPQQNTPGQPTAQPGQTPANPGQAPNQPGQPQQNPADSATTPGATPNAQTPQATDSQTMTGTVVKQGNKYVFQDAATGATYDIDHQDEVKQYDGKKVKVHGTVDQSTKTIHIQ